MQKKFIIAGYGFVGKAVFEALIKENELRIVDPAYTPNTIADHPDAEGVIICVGTPNDSEGGCDVSQIYNVLDQIPAHMPVLIKSTVIPDKLEKIIKDFPNHSITYGPEFLRAATANEDFANQTYMILGGSNTTIWQHLFKSSLKNLGPWGIITCTPTEASMIKYTINCFLSLKVAFFNQIYDMCQANGANFDNISNIIKNDPRIGTSHMQVPGPDGERGFGGACFPKDTNSFVKYALDLNTPIDILDTAVQYNKTIRQ